MHKSESRIVLFGILISLCFMSGIAKVASAAGIASILFPELAALSYDVFVRPRGVWARAPLMLAITPALTALLGIVVTRHMPYGPWSISVCIVGSIAIIKGLRSPVAPAISACFLALALGETSWWYPASILAGTCVLAGLSMLHRKVLSADMPSKRDTAADVIDDELERLPGQFSWVPFFAVFLLLAYLLSTWSGLRMVFFPPLVVIAFEMFSHSDVCPWAQRPAMMPCVCTITAAAGVAAVALFDVGALSTALAMLVGVATLRLSRVHVIPALAVSLLPQVMPRADWYFPVAVAVGSTLLMVCVKQIASYSVWPWHA
ncbi:HPP family protein [Burkholderia vietnamiensis]|uniref:HPP family protein n=1 Tax=Burkholderia vietnamiensis TaxID=60552 RepID=UPI00159456C3|nr:HPP family protein [Burkholderia vietnamiensis]